MSLVTIDVRQGCHSRLADIRDGDFVLIPVDADIDDGRRQPFIDDRVPNGRHGAFSLAFEDRLKLRLLIGTGRGIDVKPGLAAAFVKICWPISDNCELHAGEIHTVGTSLFVVPREHGGTPSFVRLDISGQPAGTKGLAATDLEAAPDRFEESRWEGLFFGLNGFVINGHRWFAYPNHNLLRFINPEMTTSFTWSYEALRKTFYKIDLESRFVCFNLYWDYISIGCFNEILEHLVTGANRVLPIETHVLVAANDGFWQGRGEAEVREVISRYVAPKTMMLKDASHLWVATPENATALLQRLEDSPSGHDP